LWHIAGSPALGPPAFDGKLAFFLTKSHTVLALDPTNGAQVWAARADTGAVETRTYTFAGCTVGDQWVACGDNGDLIAFDRGNGAYAWRFRPSIGHLIDGDPFIAVDSTFYAVTWEGGSLYALNARTGTPRWVVTIPTPSTHIRKPAADSDIVVGAYRREDHKPTTGGVIAVDARTGVLRWNTPFPRILPDSDTSGAYVTLWHDVVLASCNSGRIFAFDRATGAILWNVPGVGLGVPRPNTPGPTQFYYYDARPLVAVGTTLYASSLSGWFVAYDLLLHREAWRVEPKIADGNGDPIYADENAVYVEYLKGEVVSFSMKDGSVLSVTGTNRLLGSIALGADRFFIRGYDGFYAYAK
jgi:outer membrane protein assembly factor BamB